MKTYKETFDEGIWDRTKAKAAGAVAGAKGWAGQTGRNVMGKDPGDASQVGADAKLQAQADSLSKGGAAKLQKLVVDVEKDLVDLSGAKDINEFTKANPNVKDLLDNINKNIAVLNAGQVPLPDGDGTATTTPPTTAAPTTASPTTAAPTTAAPTTGAAPDGQQTLPGL